MTEAAPDRENSTSVKESLDVLRQRMPDILAEAQVKVRNGTLGLIGWGLAQPRVRQMGESSEHWCFVGDLHGDFLAWFRLFEHVRRRQDFRLCLMGDLVDRGPFSVECFAAVLEAALRFPGQILWIKGNHDEGVCWSSAMKRFVATTEPAEFVDWLNVEPVEPNNRMAWGRLFVDVVRRLPVAVRFDDGLLATHGGIPLVDLWPLTSLEALHSWRALADFTWGRCAAVPRNASHRMVEERQTSPSRSGFGHRDFDDFCIEVATVFPVKRMVRGHDHVAEGADIPDSYEGKLLTLTACGFVNQYGMTYYGADGPYRRSLSVAVGKAGELPEAQAVDLMLGEIEAVYPEFRGTPELAEE